MVATCPRECFFGSLLSLAKMGSTVQPNDKIAIRFCRLSLDREHPPGFRPPKIVSQFQELVRIDVRGTHHAELVLHVDKTNADDFALEIALNGIFMNTGHTTFRSA